MVEKRRKEAEEKAREEAEHATKQQAKQEEHGFEHSGKSSLPQIEEEEQLEKGDGGQEE